MNETRARQRIRKAVENRGFKVLTMDWEPWYNGGEMSGICGGWLVETDRPWEPNCNHGSEATGLSVDEVLAYIDYFFTPDDPCDCYPGNSPDRMPMRLLKDEAEGVLHNPKCRWRIEYRLPWWTR